MPITFPEDDACIGIKSLEVYYYFRLEVKSHFHSSLVFAIGTIEFGLVVVVTLTHWQISILLTKSRIHWIRQSQLYKENYAVPLCSDVCGNIPCMQSSCSGDNCSKAICILSSVLPGPVVYYQCLSNRLMALVLRPVNLYLTSYIQGWLQSSLWVCSDTDWSFPIPPPRQFATHQSCGILTCHCWLKEHKRHHNVTPIGTLFYI